MSTFSSDFWKQHLRLQQHVEGGWYSEVYRSDLIFTADQLSRGERHACTHIYFLLEKGNFSAFHRIQSDELWHFYSGDPIVIHEIDTSGALHEHLLGNDPVNGFLPFCIINAGNWFASTVYKQGDFGLVGCTVAPGFHFDDFELAYKKDLSAKYPQHAMLIEKLTRQ